MKELFNQTSKRFIKRVQKFHEGLKKKSTIEKFEIPDTKDLKKEKIQVVDISAKSVAKAVFMVFLMYALFQFVIAIKTLLIVFFVSLFFSAALDPAVDWLESKRIPRSVGVILIYFVLLSIIIVVIGSMVPIIVDQISSLVSNFTKASFQFFEKLQSGKGLGFLPTKYRDWIVVTLNSINLEDIIGQVLNNLSGIASQVKDFASGSLKTISTTVGAGVSVGVSIASGLFNFMLVLFLTFFMAVDKSHLNDFFHALFPKRYGNYITEKMQAIQSKIGSWVRGQVLLSVIMFITSFFGLLIIGMGAYALTLALIMGIAEFIPYVGPLLFLSFALPIAFGMGFGVVLKLIIFYIILQFVEGNIFVPSVMQKAVGLSPIVVLLVLIIGFQFLGVIGAIIAVPLTTAVAIFVNDYMKSVAGKK